MFFLFDIDYFRYCYLWITLFFRKQAERHTCATNMYTCPHIHTYVHTYIKNINTIAYGNSQLKQKETMLSCTY